eukprot:10553929-Lingulodinium_polyedra.AAC.1
MGPVMQAVRALRAGTVSLAWWRPTRWAVRLRLPFPPRAGAGGGLLSLDAQPSSPGRMGLT